MWFKTGLALLMLLPFQQQRLMQVSLEYQSRILEKGKYITVTGKVYFNRQTAELTTHLIKPFETVTIVNADGDLRIHDPLANTLVQNRSSTNTSEASYLSHFLSGTYSDLGLRKAGYTISGTKTDNGMLITTWVPQQGFSSPIGSIELVKEKDLPIYIAFFDHKKKQLGRMYFSKFSKLADTYYPGKIVEIMYKEKNDSMVTTKNYSNPLLNAAVEQKYIQYKIPSNARVIEQ